MDWKLLWNVKRVWLDEEKNFYTYYQMLISSWVLLPATSKKINDYFFFETFCGTIYVEGKGIRDPVSCIVKDIEVCSPSEKLKINTNSFHCFEGANQQLLCIEPGFPEEGNYILKVNINGSKKIRNSSYIRYPIDLSTHIYPYNNQVLREGEINFRWSEVPNAYYGLEVQTIDGHRVINLSFLKDLVSFTYSMKKGNYRWRPLTFDSDELMETNNCAYSSWSYFIVE